jgi:hypothetical protein
MTMLKIVGYKAKWNFSSHTGKIDVRVYYGNLTQYTVYTFQPQTPEEMSMVVDILRNEKPISYDSTTKELLTGEWEVIGEGEP